MPQPSHSMAWGILLSEFHGKLTNHSEMQALLREPAESGNTRPGTPTTVPWGGMSGSLRITMFAEAGQQSSASPHRHPPDGVVSDDEKFLEHKTISFYKTW